MNQKLRAVTLADARLLWEWRNDTETRKQSISVGEIPWDRHVEWLEAKLRTQDCRMWIRLVDNMPVALARYDRIEPNQAEISFLTAPAFRGRGMATALLKESLPRAESELELKRVIGYVRVTNVASLAVLRRAGFIEQETLDYKGVRCTRMIKRLEDIS